MYCKITDEDICQFQEDGAICLRNVFSQKWIDLVRDGIRKNMEDPSPFGESLKGTCFDVSQLTFVAIQNQFYHEHVLVKEPGTTKETPWHHDQSYYPIDGDKICSIWMPVDTVPIESTVQFVKGSHKWGKWFKPRKFETANNYPLKENQDPESQKRNYEDVPINEINSGKWDILEWACEPGDCIVFHGKTVHGAPGNISKVNYRRVLSTRWLGEDTTIGSRPWDVSPPTTGGLNVGDKTIFSKEFRIVWKVNQQEAEDQQIRWNKYV